MTDTPPGPYPPPPSTRGQPPPPAASPPTDTDVQWGAPPPLSGGQGKKQALVVAGIVAVLLVVGLVALVALGGDDPDGNASGSDTPSLIEDGFVEDCDADAGEGLDYEPASFEIFDTEAEMNGVIDASTPCELDDLLADNPTVDTIVMIDVPGSADDDANLVAARMVREAGLTTVVVADGPGIASGGTDFFAAGVNRIVESGAVVGVHSWATGDGTEGKDLPRDDPEHQKYLDFYAEIGIPEDFYWFTLEAATADDIYNMTDDELLDYKIATVVEPS